ncbi:hypothetical protein FJZ36_06065 [Candidatus Poribacteria bacterium]|nr:hypothetical protein [Candidatus Poribacteria bacterium]
MNAVLQIALLTALEVRRRRTFLAGVLLSTLFLAGIITLTTLAERASDRQEAAQQAAPTESPSAAAPDEQQTAEPLHDPSDPDDADHPPRRRSRRFEHAMANQAIRAGGMWIIRTFATLMAIVLAAGSIAPEIESGVMHGIATKPIRRDMIVVGKWLGLNAVLLAYLLALGVVLSAVLTVRSGEIPSDVLRASVVSLLFPMLFITLGVTYSTFASIWVSMGLGLFSWVVGAQEYGLVRAAATVIRRMGRGPSADVLDAAGTLAGFLVPTGRIGLWVDKMGGSNQLTIVPPIVTRPPATVWDLVYVAVYVVVVVTGGVLWFRRRDL